MSRHTKRGQIELAKQSQAVVSTIVDGVISIQVNTLKLPIPERTYHASTADGMQTEDGFGRFVFGQFRALSRGALQNAVVVEMPMHCVKMLHATFTDKFREQLQSAGAGMRMPSFPSADNGDLSSLTYSAHFCRIFVNREFGAALDFYELPVTEKPTGDVRSIIRVTCSAAVVAAVVGWCDSFIREGI